MLPQSLVSTRCGEGHTPITLVCILIMLCSASAQAGVISISTLVNAPFVDGKYEMYVGETRTLSVFGQLKPGSANAGNGIFSWDVDLRIGDTGILDLLNDTLDRDGWTNFPATSSDGTPTVWGLDAIYDSGETNTEMGVGSPVQLFSINFTALTVGESSLTIEPDDTIGADFITWNTETGGDYSDASVPINALVPEPASIIFLASSVSTLLWFWRKRSK